MLKILFVDDDMIARRSIAAKIDWASYGWELIYTAKDAMDALDYMKQEQPDVILSDIKMPVMDGISMAMIARNYYPDIKYIFLSGYKEFEYAKQALKLNAIDYINKPIDTQQLIDAIKEAERLSKRERKSNEILKHCLFGLMKNHFREIDDSILKAFDLNIQNGYGTAGFLDFMSPCESAPAPAGQPVAKLTAFLSSQFKGSVFINTVNMQIFFIFTCSNIGSEEEFRLQLKHFESCVRQFLQKNLAAVFEPSFRYGTIIRDLGQLYLSYESILQEFRSETTDLLNQVKDYLEQNYGQENLTLTRIASHFYVNHCYLTSLFKESFGINLYDYLIQTRMKKAGQLAISTNMKVYEIAEAVGYKNSQYFSVSFKKYFNCTVMEYKKSAQTGFHY